MGNRMRLTTIFGPWKINFRTDAHIAKPIKPALAVIIDWTWSNLVEGDEPEAHKTNKKT